MANGPLVILNSIAFYCTYGDKTLSRPIISVTDTGFLYPDSTLFSIGESLTDY